MSASWRRGIRAGLTRDGARPEGRLATFGEASDRASRLLSHALSGPSSAALTPFIHVATRSAWRGARQLPAQRATRLSGAIVQRHSSPLPGDAGQARFLAYHVVDKVKHLHTVKLPRVVKDLVGAVQDSTLPGETRHNEGREHPPPFPQPPVSQRWFQRTRGVVDKRSGSPLRSAPEEDPPIPEARPVGGIYLGSPLPQAPPRRGPPPGSAALGRHASRCVGRWPSLLRAPPAAPRPAPRQRTRRRAPGPGPNDAAPLPPRPPTPDAAVSEAAHSAHSTPASWAVLRRRLREAQQEFAEELHTSWDKIIRPAPASREGFRAVQEHLASYRGLIESKIQVELLAHRHVAEQRLIAVMCSLELPNPGPSLVTYCVPAALRDLWNRTDPAYVSPRRRLGIKPVGSLPKKLREVAEGGSWVERHVLRPLAGFAHDAVMVGRAVALLWLFTPLMASAPAALGLGLLRDAWCRLLIWTLEAAGPAFIKWGQWAGARPDLLPRDICQALETLHSGARPHSWGETRRIVQNSFGRSIEYLFDEFEHEPVASGSIAQVHRAVLSEAGAGETGMPPGMVVAVKVRHPGVQETMEKDFALMERVAELIGSVESLEWIRLDESVKQFGAPMREQLDLRIEARNLDRFNQNFRRWPDCWFPEPLRPLVTEDVLVETFELGESVTKFVDGTSRVLLEDDPAETPLRQHICSIGVNIFFKMVLNDNFIHGDMHPGNVIVMAEPERVRNFQGRVKSGFTPWNPIAKVVMLDAGMAIALTEEEKQWTMKFFQASMSLDGRKAGEAVLNLGHQTASPEGQRAYLDAMGDYFGTLTDKYMKENSSEALARTMDLLREHRINITGEVSALLVQMFVLEGWAATLDREMRIMEILKMMLPSDWELRMSPSVDRIMRNTTSTTRA